MSFAHLRSALAARRPRDFPVHEMPRDHLPPGGLTAAAVLVPLFVKDREPHVLLTRRQADLRHHPGQVSFPGGRLHPGEGHLAAALRESREEIGLDPGAVDVLGRLDETLVLASPFRLTPWVGVVPYPYPFEAHPGEVDAILHIPLGALARPGARRSETRQAYGMSHEVHHYTVGTETVWGATARVLTQLVGIWSSP